MYRFSVWEREDSGIGLVLWIHRYPEMRYWTESQKVRSVHPCVITSTTAALVLVGHEGYNFQFQSKKWFLSFFPMNRPYAAVPHVSGFVMKLFKMASSVLLGAIIVLTWPIMNLRIFKKKNIFILFVFTEKFLWGGCDLAWLALCSILGTFFVSFSLSLFLRLQEVPVKSKKFPWNHKSLRFFGVFWAHMYPHEIQISCWESHMCCSSPLIPFLFLFWLYEWYAYTPPTYVVNIEKLRYFGTKPMESPTSTVNFMYSYWCEVALWLSGSLLLFL